MSGKVYRRGDPLHGLEFSYMRNLAFGATERSGPFAVDQGTVREEFAIRSRRCVVVVTHRARHYYWAEYAQHMIDANAAELLGTWEAMKPVVAQWLDAGGAAKQQ